eukprot:TRINITY_DN16846_c0_g2_i1.p1 TRINITY_DN16846_c0_g2~~TRINITY_DN16846_c0_g2_i1.p1  ORF type:complete len:630 (+),score=115.95 TRINITY_DN16846_c0_g2_i1:47-1936(+)
MAAAAAEMTREALVRRRPNLEDLLKRRFFVAPSFEIYGGTAGLYDFGPPGSALKTNLLALWRRHFVLEESMLEIETSCLTPEPVLKASGHVEKFNDFMVRDVKNPAFFYRADRLLNDHVEKLLEKEGDPAVRESLELIKAQVDNYTMDELEQKMKELDVKSPDTGNDLTKPYPFNLMFGTQIGPTGTTPGFMRPETAQGIFVNFKRLLDYNAGRMPFAAASIGLAFRNEIAPRSGLLRVREFTLAEIEHFVKPNEKEHPKFKSVADLVVTLFPRGDQITTKKTTEMTIGNAVKQGIVDNETLGYFMGRVYLFLLHAGVRRAGLRFRQHLKHEMAHYACDCWDAEILSSYGWIECVGVADRSCYDLTVHTKSTKRDLSAFKEFKDHQTVEFVEMKPVKGRIGAVFRRDAKPLLDWLEELDEAGVQSLQQAIQTSGLYRIKLCNDIEYEITKDMVGFTNRSKKVTGETYLPSVIEPSFGMGRILYCLLEHSYYARPEDEQRGVLSFTPTVAPVKCSVLPLSGNSEFVPAVTRLERDLTNLGITCKVDDSGAAIGRRYARTDEIGIPFGITVDFDTLSTETVTLRERDSTKQIRAAIDDIAPLVHDLVQNKTTWEEVCQRYPSFEAQESGRA